jgi:hypothetical protein
MVVDFWLDFFASLFSVSAEIHGAGCCCRCGGGGGGGEVVGWRKELCVCAWCCVELVSVSCWQRNVLAFSFSFSFTLTLQ